MTERPYSPDIGKSGAIILAVVFVLFALGAVGWLYLL